MIHKPWTDGCGSYIELDNVADLRQFVKRRRKLQCVIFRGGGDLLPCKCAWCKKTIGRGDSNRVDIQPRKEQEPLVAAFHYECSWEALFAAIDKLGVDLGLLS